MAKTGPKLNDETKARIFADLLAGSSVTETARKYNLNHSTVSRMRAGIVAEDLHEIAQKKAEDFGDQLASYLSTLLGALKAQAEVVSDKKWIEKQSASELAILHGTMADKGIRLLEAAQTFSGPEPDSE